MTPPQRPDLMSTKALTIRRLAPLIGSASVDVGHIISRWNWRDRAHVVIEFLQGAYDGHPLIVRSSASNEDTWHTSAAGKYDSVALPRHATARQIEHAVDRVFASYADTDDRSYVFVQRFIDGISAATVVTTRVAATGAPYYVLAVDESAHASDAITAGRGLTARTWYVAHGQPLTDLPAPVNQLMRTVLEVETATGSEQLDIEMVIDDHQVAHLLQVRPLVLTYSGRQPADHEVQAAIDTCSRQLAAGASSQQVLGSSPYFSNMADWNPAEMIGQRPRPLALALYRGIITDRTWAEQRFDYGYRDVRQAPLLHDFAGQPYIDVRASLSSFVPLALPAATARILVDLQLEQLVASPYLHDRLEFDVALTSVAFDTDARLERLREAGLSISDCTQLRSALTKITQSAIERLGADAASIDHARATRHKLCAEFIDPLQRAIALLKAASPSIALPFAHLARAAFIATSFSRSAVTTGLATTQSVTDFMRSLGTISAQLRSDGNAVARGDLSWDQYVDLYGDLRPGTYDPAVPRYRDAPEIYLRPFISLAGLADSSPISSAPWYTSSEKALTAHLAWLGLDCDAARLTNFMRAAIAAREAGKFELSCWISAILEGLIEAGEAVGHNRDDVSYWTLVEVRQLASGALDPDRLRHLVTDRRLRQSVTDRLHLPPTISSHADLRCFSTHPGRPTYVGTGKSIGRVYLQPKPTDLLEGIVVLPNADPGFEWLFSRPIQGIITMYGGANSHMAVRCAESGIPAAIGVGQDIYAKLADSTLVQLDCAGQTIEVVR